MVLIKIIILSRGDRMTLQRTFIMLKPDGVKRGLIGEIIKRFEQKGFTLLNAQLMTVTVLKLNIIIWSIRTSHFSVN